MSESDDDNREQAEEFAYTTQAVTSILSAADCPKTFRDYIDCLIGIAGGNIEFDTTDEQIERRKKAIKPSKLKGKKEYWARDRRRDLLKWQEENNWTLLEYKESKYDSKLKRRPPSHFKLYLVGYVQQVVTRAKQNKNLWDIDWTLSIKESAQRLVDELRVRPKVEPEKKYIDLQVEVHRKISSARTNLDEAVRLLEKHDFELTTNEEILVTSIEQLIAKVRERGFVDPMDMKIMLGVEREPKP
jgi:hypothetical protein